MKDLSFQDWGVLAIANFEPNVWPAKPIDHDKPFKWQTRRILKPQPEHVTPGTMQWQWRKSKNCTVIADTEARLKQLLAKHHARYTVGETVYVKEALCRSDDWKAFYRADDTKVGQPGECALWRWQRCTLSSRYMPRYCARYYLKIMGIRVQRVQDISEKDAVAEGIKPRFCCNGDTCGCMGLPIEPPRMLFQEEWDAIHGKGAWERNAWVFAYSFMRTEKP